MIQISNFGNILYCVFFITVAEHSMMAP